MRCAIIFVSDDPGACALFEKEQEALIPRSLRDAGRVKEVGFDFFTSIYNPSTSRFQLDQHVLYTAKKAEGVAILCDSRYHWLAVAVSNACFVANVELNPEVRSYKNILQATLTRMIKNLAHVYLHMRDAGSRYALQLPFRNFVANELRELEHLFANNTLTSEFVQTLDQAISNLNRRRMPKRKEDYPNKYYVDDEEIFFSYGKEHHSEFESGNPHLPLCVLNGHFRFGHRIVKNEHYNVSKDNGKNGKISRLFMDCHDRALEVKERSHVNMFSNDYWTV
ncbi:hypothetical protein [Pseudomonas syringae group genomosp. 3]|uniref:hypothetical protein n=1 Tax=Pseudomonas syringae group genomosp. 3 TaxID=251701 RepID=UPI0006E4BA59|nr:hypothetical protein [Pseudomonas syringae group genomosp. 3]KPW57626.1 hypothetical protein ALO86_200158 [Pseudomonas syringae pv. berberidis]KPY15060.1 Uncharacterized protein ALO54_00362 [Pseudomonas syringae pv. philadelphi]RMM24235.1 hypothetical protein ALQ83_04132 [Pseudomonas syringae pv. berberidis]RMP60016.1 hypothetical protein ALQ19_01228 [Pseudomonas syringae pv. berberidis]RMQ31864.1 hypothetical protein ALQ06_200027 [Pseudomonas syringae pv. berberidis]